MQPFSIPPRSSKSIELVSKELGFDKVRFFTAKERFEFSGMKTKNAMNLWKLTFKIEEREKHGTVTTNEAIR